MIRIGFGSGASLWFYCIFLYVLQGLTEGCIVTTPSLVRLGAQETVLVRNTGNATRNVTLHATDYPAEARLLFMESFLMGHGEEKLVYLRLDETKFSSEDLQSNRSMLVSLRVHCGDAFNKAAVLLLKPSSGYIFLQTDKPIYSPGQDVLIRIVAVDEALLPSTDNVHLEIKNPQDIVSYTWDVLLENPNTGLISHTYHLPKYPMLGKWKVIVTYGRHKNLKSEVSFQVKEYVLPTFSVQLGMPNVILPSVKGGISVTVKASYVYGKPVTGNAILTFSVRNEVNHDVMFGTKLVDQLVGGKAFFTVPVDELKNGSEWKDWVDGNRLSVRAVVVEEATAKQEAVLDDSSLFSNAAYTVSLENTRRDFKPGTQVAVVADIRHADGQPASGVDARITATDENGTEVRDQKKTNKEGKALFVITTRRGQQRLNIAVRTLEGRQSEASATLVNYTSPVNAFISIDHKSYTKDDLQVDNHFNRYLTVDPDDFSAVFYQVMTRGKIVAHGTAHHPGQNKYEVNFRLTEAMAPKFRLLVFGFRQGHVVADSEDFEIGEHCSYLSTIKLYPSVGHAEPGEVKEIGVQGQTSTIVGLLAVDKAAYLLGDTSLLTRKKLFGALRSHDPSCGPGGGVTAEEVLANAGVVIISAEDSTDSITSENSCAARVHRRKRDVREARIQFATPLMRLCCDVGTLPDRLRRHCSTREDIIRRHFNNPEGNECADAFAYCCARTFQFKDGGPLFMDNTDLPRARGGSNQLSVPGGPEEEGSSDIRLRNDFREAWLFEQGTIGDNGWYNFSSSLPHSITTWSVQAMAVSPEGGVCVAEPVEVVAFRKVFLQVSFPSTVVRNEQVEIVATLFNYDDESQDATISLHGGPDLCIASKHPRLPDTKGLRVEKNSASSISFPVVPLRQGNLPFEIHLRSRGHADRVEKTLTVVPEGTPDEQSFSVTIDPSNEQRRRKRAILTRAYRDILEEDDGRQVITIIPRYPYNTVPDTESCSVSVIGSEAASVGGAAIANVESLISMPKGCGEQTMMIMAPVLYSYTYLKVKNMLNESDRVDALKYLLEGYGRELKFRNENGSFATFQKRPGNVWLTAFVLKVFCEAQNVIDISPDVIEKGLLWLSRQQQPDGSFEELDPIVHREMLGSVHGKTAMTAFVLLTFQECAAASASVSEGINTTIARAQFYMRERLDAIKFPYIAALTAYALSFAPGPDRQKSMDVLRAHLLEDTDMNSLSTGDEATGIDVEGTSYALLAHLKHHDMDSSKKFVNWLLRHRSASGSFVSTQDTVVALQALSEFSIQASNAAPDISGVVLTDNTLQDFRIKRDNAALLQEFQIVNAKGKIVVNASGIGTAALNVRLRYNVLVPSQQGCKFALSVAAEIYRESIEGPGILPDILVQKLGVQWSHLASRHRVGRAQEKPRNKPDDENTYQIKVCTRYLGGNESNMAIVDVGTFTGFRPIKDDLNKVVNDTAGVDKYEERENGVFFYLKTVKAATETCLKFRVEKEFAVTNLQTSTVKVYDYYKPNELCSQSYRPEPASTSVELFCDGNMCKCATAECPVNETFIDVIKTTGKIACDDHDFVWKGKVSANYVLAGYRHLAFDIDKVIKEGEENTETLEGHTRLFLGRQLCNTSNLDVGREYIIFGKDSDEDITDGGLSVRYPLNHRVRIYHTASASKLRGKKTTVQTVVDWLSNKFTNEGGCNE
ncbi:complement C3 [Dermacentor silvarum]|uniref:complement C3 n=1 Tax=Dermacentor silvarum TaxID=543639 RepID=UPI002101CDB8|nr:complement C3 [Dermacentor silvarum]